MAETIKRDALNARIQVLKFTHSQAAQIELKKVELERQELVQKRFGETEPGITYQTFNEYDKLFNGKSQEIKDLIIKAFGVDPAN